jgi:hypothetical protein
MAYEAQFEDSNTVELASPENEPPEPVVEPVAPTDSSAALLEPVTLPSSVRPPLTTISLPRGARPIEPEPSEPELEEIVLPSHLRTAD